jgi:hypothetical protein
MEERSKIFRVLLTLSLVLLAHGVCKAEIFSPARLTITDVIPSAFSVVWSVSEPATCGLNVFRDAGGTAPYDGAQIVSESAEHFPAENIGVMKVRVAGLEPGSQYFFQTKTTFKKDGSVSLYPEGPPFMEVRTEESSIVVNNDVLALQISPPGGRSNLGILLIGMVDKASYPISGWTREGVPHNWAEIDTNNFYDKETHLNLELEGGEVINLTVLGGGSCFVETQDLVPEKTGGTQLLEVVASLPLSICNNLLLQSMPWIPLLLLN